MPEPPSALEPAPEELALAANWPSFEGLQILFADQLIISFRGDHFVLTVGQVADPQIFPQDRPSIDKLRERGLQITPLFRAAIPVSQMVEFLKAAMKLVDQSGLGKVGE